MIAPAIPLHFREKLLQRPAGPKRLPVVPTALLCAMLPYGAWAENSTTISPWDNLTTPYVRHLLAPNDIPSAATSFVQDAAGFIWIATQDGLVRWDGYRAKIFRHSPKDPYSLPANVVTGLALDHNGTMFVALEEGDIARYDVHNEHFIKLPNNRIGIGLYPAFVPDETGGLWLGNSNGLAHWSSKTNSWETVEFPVHTQVSALLRTEDGAIWIGTDRGLFRRTSDNPQLVNVLGESQNPQFAKSNIRSLVQTRDGDIWFGTNDGRIGNFSRPGTIRQADIPNPNGAIFSLLELPSGDIAAATAGTGLIFVDKKTGRPVQLVKADPLRPSGLGDNFIYHLYLDKSGGLWIGHTRGVDYIPTSNGAFQTILPSERNTQSFSASYITAIASQLSDRIWFGTDKGSFLLVREGSGFSFVSQPFKSGDSFPAALVQSIAAPRNGETWIGSAQGLFETHNGRLRKFSPLADTPIRSLLAEEDVLWIGSERHGLQKLDLVGHNLTPYLHNQSDPNSILDNFVLALIQDPGRGLWIGTAHGLNLFDGTVFHAFRHDASNSDSLPSDVVAGLFRDSRGRIWAGTEGGGLGVLEGDPLGAHHFRHISREQGLPSENVDTIQEDSKGRIWVATDAGIAVIDPDSFSVKSFSTGDGVALTSYFPNSGAKTADGTLLFGAVGGITVVHPDRLANWDYQPQIVATSIQVGQRSESPSSRLIVPADDQSLHVEFSALDYSAPEKNRYSYKLEGFDKDWISTDADHRLAAYTNLPPGRYSLLLRGSNRSGEWTQSPTSLAIEVEPTWYQTIAFKIACATILAASVWGFIRSRTALLRHRQKELESQVADRTTEIASLLHNSGEGFLSFGPDLIIDRQYSRACETFLGEKPDGKNASALLFAENARHVAFATESVPAALTSSDPQKRDLILSLLPKEINRRSRRLKTHYAVLENGHLMVVLRDITTERRLAERVASEHRRLGMIVAAITDSRDFFTTLSSFKDFLGRLAAKSLATGSSVAQVLQETYRQIHTFKGEFNQLSFENLPAALHALEESLDDLRLTPETIGIADIQETLSTASLNQALDQDLSMVRQALGADFLTRGGQVSMTPDQAVQLKRLISRWRAGDPIDLRQPEVRQLVEEIEQLGAVSLKDELISYDQTIAQVALRLEKEVGQLVVTGEDDIWIDPEVYGPFLRSLIHVFRNCVAHGIEPPEVRLEHGKEEFGKISCHVQRSDDLFRIIIADDGAGINIDALRLQIIEQGLCSEKEAELASDAQIIDFIFQDQISTSSEADLWSGRGVGLAAVRQEIEALGGRAFAETSPGQGTQFIFEISLPHAIALKQERPPNREP